MAERMFTVYAEEKSIRRTWDKFNRNGGYNQKFIDPEDVEAEATENGMIVDIDLVAERIERNISDLAGTWFSKPADVATVLKIMFGTEDRSGNPLYTLTVHGKKNNKTKIEFTDEGKVWLKNRLECDTKGRYDPYGIRKRRYLYNVAEGAKRPNRARPRFLGGA